MHTYQIKFTDDEGEHFERVESCDPGSAFARCQKAHPGAVMVEAARRETSQGRTVAYTAYPAPPVQRDPVKEPRPCCAPHRDELDGIMPFYDEVVKK